MKRHEFVGRGAGWLAALGGCPALLAAADGEATEQAAATRSKAEQTAAFSRSWVEGFLAGTDSTLRPSERVRLLESCGRACARHGVVKNIQQFEGRPEAFVKSMQEHLGPGMAGIEGHTAWVTYPSCFCPLVADIPSRLSDTWCNCSRGWMKEVFRVVTGHEVKVTLLESVKRGGEVCRFSIRI